MRRYRMKPIIVDAFQWTAKRAKDHATWPSWLTEAWNKTVDTPGAFAAVDKTAKERIYFIVTPQGPLSVAENDFIIKGTGGIIFSINGEAFGKTYDAIECNEAGVPLRSVPMNGAYL